MGKEKDDRRREELTDRELLIRLDERGENMEKRLDSHANRLRTVELAIVGGLLGLLGAAWEYITKGKTPA